MPTPSVDVTKPSGCCSYIAQNRASPYTEAINITIFRIYSAANDKNDFQPQINSNYLEFYFYS